MFAARDAADRAAALDSDLLEGHTVVGIVGLQYDWKWFDAKKELDRAVELAPESAWIRRWRARWYESQAQLDDALADLQAALKVDPLSNEILCGIARVYRFQGQPQLGVPYAQRASDPLCAVEAEYAAGQTDKPLPSEGDPFHLAVLATMRGDRSPGARLMDTADELRTQHYTSPIGFARVAAAMKDYDPMFQWLDTAHDERSLGMPYFHLWPGIPKEDPRFAALMEKMNLHPRP
jgi:tetratricopeptide (TPR) repeat protein